MFSAYLYGVETWWKIDNFPDIILIHKRKLLKSFLGIKKGTPNDLVYIELNRPDMLSRIKDWQHKCYQKVRMTSVEDAIAAEAYQMCKNLLICQYYDHILFT